LKIETKKRSRGKGEVEKSPFFRLLKKLKKRCPGNKQRAKKKFEQRKVTARKKKGLARSGGD